MIADDQTLTEYALIEWQKATGHFSCCPGCADIFEWKNFYPTCKINASERESVKSMKTLLDSGELYPPEAADLRNRIFDRYMRMLWHDELLRRAYKKAMKPKKHAGHELGAREFTLTYSPQWCNDTEARELMIQAVTRLMKYYKNELMEFEVVGEVTKQGCSHIHGYYLLENGLKMTDKNFKRAYKYWNPKKTIGKGFEGGHHAVVKSESDFKGYIDKCPDAWYKFKFSRDDIQNANEEELQEETDPQGRVEDSEEDSD